VCAKVVVVVIVVEEEDQANFFLAFFFLGILFDALVMIIELSVTVSRQCGCRCSILVSTFACTHLVLHVCVA
jgi:hypothetical protein